LIIKQGHSQTAPNCTFGGGIDFTTGNGPSYVIAWAIEINMYNSHNPTYIIQVTSMASNANFDIMQVYHNTSNGHIVRDLPKAPLSERTKKNFNIAILYSSYLIYNYIYPAYINSRWRPMLSCRGFDPDNDTTSLDSPIGVGNYVSQQILNYWRHNGLNFDGFDGNRKYNARPFSDVVTDYQPKNTAYKLKFPNHWQPLIKYVGNSSYTIQNFIVPQWGTLHSWSGLDPNNFHSPRPDKSANYNSADYKNQADEVLAASYSLTDKMKLTAEYFDGKVAALTGIITQELNIRSNNNINPFDYVPYHWLLHVSMNDAGIVCWKEKLKWDSVRPTTAIRYLYNDSYNLSAWGGVGKGPVTDIKGKEWISYLSTADHPEYPSGSSCFCHAHAQAQRLWWNNDSFPTPIIQAAAPFQPGSSIIEPGITPAAVTNLGPWYNRTQWAWECGLSRLWAGVHFMDAIVASKNMCTDIGTKAYNRIQDLLFNRPIVNDYDDE